MRLRYCFLGLLLFVVGCGDNIVAVSGRVTLGDKPLPNATVVFQPVSEEPNPGPGSRGKTDANGEYKLTLLTKDVPGAIIGKHKVSITAYEGDDGTIPSSGSNNTVFRKLLVAPEYNSKSTLFFDVPAGGTTEANFKVEAPPPATK